ncbi:MAG: hypothetical protein LBS68_00205 [Puniceicoccales bacterium]|jgi:hypothetical protein|nr:hypothetical protein [Puniceicoccales bacterium]
MHTILIMEWHRMGNVRRGAFLAVLRWGVFLSTPLLCFFLSTGSCRAKYHHYLRRQEVLLARRAELRDQLQKLEVYLGRFSRENSFRQRVIRERLGYADSDEFVYLFEE